MLMLPSIVAIVGLSLEVVGVVLMARQFANVPIKQMPNVLASALGRGELAQGLVEIARLSGEKPIDFVQGLAFVCLGILVQMSGVIAEIGLKLSVQH